MFDPKCDCHACAIARECVPMFESIVAYVCEHMNAHEGTQLDASRIDAFQEIRGFIEHVCDVCSPDTPDDVQLIPLTDQQVMQALASMFGVMRAPLNGDNPSNN